MCCLACSSDKTADLQGARPTRLTAQATQILSFENPSDWQGIHATHPEHTHGAVSGEVNVNGWTVVTSVPMSTIGESGPVLTIDIKVPFLQQYWGEVRLIVKIPSQNEWYRELGSQSIVGFTPDSFHTLTFNIPGDLQAKFGNTYNDLIFTVIINAAAGTYLLDRLNIQNMLDSDDGPDGSDEAESEPTDSVVVSIMTPANVPFEQVTLGASADLKIGANVQVTAPGQIRSVVTSLGTTVVDRNVEPDAELGDIWSVGRLDIGDRVYIRGSVYTPEVILGNDVLIDGAVIDDVALTPFSEFSWTVAFPSNSLEHIWLEPGMSAELQPGYYSTVRAAPNATLSLQTGIYYFDSLEMESDSSLILSQINGPVIVYVRSSVRLRCNITTESEEAADFLIVYLGDSDVHLERSFSGAFIAPQANLILHSAIHFGTFYGRKIRVEANATIIHQPAGSILVAADIDVEECVNRIVPREDLSGIEKEISYQRDIFRYCVAVNVDDCLARIMARIQVDRNRSALQFIDREMTGARYLGVARDRTEKWHAVRTDEVLARMLCTENDADGDLVPDSIDLCPDTPELTPTDEFGCPTELPLAPDDEDVHAILDNMGFFENAFCKNASIPGIGLPGGFFKRRDDSGTVYIVMSRASGQPAGCAVNYEFELMGETLDGIPAHLYMAFHESEATGDLVGLGKPVPAGFIQFQTFPADPGDKGKLSTDFKPYYGWIRARAYNAGGRTSGWTEWKSMTPRDCLSLGFTCGL